MYPSKPQFLAAEKFIPKCNIGQDTHKYHEVRECLASMTHRCNGKVWCVTADWCGLLCVVMGWIVVLFVNYSTQAHAILPLIDKFESNWPLVVVASVMYQCVISLIFWSHFMCMFSAPGLYPADPDAKLAWEEQVRLLEQNAPPGTSEGEIKTEIYNLRKQLRYCVKCELFKPEMVHHCSTCNRCIEDMDHHCPWVNNCVGAANIKFFLQFLFYVGVGTLWSLTAITLRGFVAYYLTPSGSPTASRRRYRLSSAEMRASMISISFCIIAFILSVFFFVFICMMAWDQYGALTSGASGIDALQGNTGSGKRSIRAAFKYVCGRDFHYTWFLPTKPPRRHKVE